MTFTMHQTVRDTDLLAGRIECAMESSEEFDGRLSEDLEMGRLQRRACPFAGGWVNESVNKLLVHIQFSPLAGRTVVGDAFDGRKRHRSR